PDNPEKWVPVKKNLVGMGNKTFQFINADFKFELALSQDQVNCGFPNAHTHVQCDNFNSDCRAFSQTVNYFSSQKTTEQMLMAEACTTQDGIICNHSTNTPHAITCGTCPDADHDGYFTTACLG